MMLIAAYEADELSPMQLLARMHNMYQEIGGRGANAAADAIMSEVGPYAATLCAQADVFKVAHGPEAHLGALPFSAACCTSRLQADCVGLFYLHQRPPDRIADGPAEAHRAVEVAKRLLTAQRPTSTFFMASMCAADRWSVLAQAEV